MVALAGHNRRRAGLSSLGAAGRKHQSANIRHNAFINMGSTLKHQSERGEDTRSLAADLNEKFKRNYRKMPRRRFCRVQFRGVAQVTPEITQAAAEKLIAQNPERAFGGSHAAQPRRAQLRFVARQDAERKLAYGQTSHSRWLAANPISDAHKTSPAINRRLFGL